MVHIKRLNERFSIDNQESFLNNVINDDDLSVLVKDTFGNTEYKPNEIVDFSDFVYNCNGMRETCNGTMEVTSGKTQKTYKVKIIDENGEIYADIDFMLVYYNGETIPFLDRLFEQE